MPQIVKHEDLTITVHRYGFQPGYYAEAKNASGIRLAFTGVYKGRGSRRRCIDAAVIEARTGQPAPDDRGCPG